MVSFSVAASNDRPLRPGGRPDTGGPAAVELPFVHSSFLWGASSELPDRPVRSLPCRPERTKVPSRPA